MSTSATSPIRYAIYTRQSRDGLQDLSSCQVQFMTCEDFARQTGEPNLHWIGERFDDEGYSGATLDRPAMRKLRKVIGLNGVDRVYAVALDRLTRNMRDAVVLLDELDRAGVELRLVHQSELTSGPEYRFLKHVLAAFAQFEREMIASRIAETRAYLKKHGRRLAGNIPYGYDADPATKQLAPNPTEARRVRAIFRRAAEGQLPKQIAFACNKQGWRTKVYHVKRSGKVRGGGRWTPRSVLAILANPVYTGRFAEGDQTRPGCHEPIVAPEFFERVQLIVSARRTTERKKRTLLRYPLRRKIICPRCGRFLTTYQSTKKTSEQGGLIYRYYSCRSNAGGWARCKGIQLPAGDVEREVRELLDDTDTWQQLLGEDAPEERVNAAVATWRTWSVPSKDDFIGRFVDRVNVGRGFSEIQVTFKPEIRTALDEQ